MADVTISSLPLGTPSSSALLPYSQSGQTLAVAPSGIIAAGVTPGTILQTVYGQDDTEYNFPNPGSSVAPFNRTSTLSINLKSVTSKILINVSAYGLGWRNSNIPGWGLFLFPGDTTTFIVDRYPYLFMNTSSVEYLAGTLSIIAQHTPGIINPTYRLVVQKASAEGTAAVRQYSAYWTIQEIAQ